MAKNHLGIEQDHFGTTQYPKNHKEHLDRVMEIHEIYKEKNAKYGDSFSKSLDKHGLVAWQVRNDDKMNRLETLLGELLKKNEDGKHVLANGLEGTDESIHDTLMDTAGYIIMLDMWLSSLKGSESVAEVYVDGKVYHRFKDEGLKESRGT